jgi:sugar/nucleoside kinase (ribokinase family)
VGRIYVVGNVNVDLMLGPQQPWPTPGTEVLLPYTDLRPGGGAGNAALALQALGADFELIGSSGDDAFGAWLTEEFAGVAGSWVKAARSTALTVGITHPNGERTFFSHLGHLEDLGLDQVMRGLGNIASGDALLLMGAFLTPRLRPHYVQLMAWARERGARIALDPGWPPEGWAVCRSEANIWLETCDHLLINELEALSWSDCADLEAAVSALQRCMSPGGLVIVKRGSDGALWYDGEQRQQCEAPRITVVDTVGAGDTFDAAYLQNWVSGHPLEDCVRFGIRTASLAVSTMPRRYVEALS